MLKKKLKINLLYLAITLPSCYPGCGINAHCEYDIFNENKCVCNSGYVGNPYEECDSEPKKFCSNMVCGTGALCKEKFDSVECSCPLGFKGNPYVQCVGMCSNSYLNN